MEVFHRYKFVSLPPPARALPGRYVCPNARVVSRAENRRDEEGDTEAREMKTVMMAWYDNATRCAYANLDCRCDKYKVQLSLL